jgi:hypothetical protein
MDRVCPHRRRTVRARPTPGRRSPVAALRTARHLRLKVRSDAGGTLGSVEGAAGDIRLAPHADCRVELDLCADAVDLDLTHPRECRPKRAKAGGLGGMLRINRPLGFRALLRRSCGHGHGPTQSRWHRLLDPIARLLVKLGPGDAYSDPWRDLAAYGRSRPNASWRACTRQLRRRGRAALSGGPAAMGGRGSAGESNRVLTARASS